MIWVAVAVWIAGIITGIILGQMMVRRGWFRGR